MAKDTRPAGVDSEGKAVFLQWEKSTDVFTPTAYTFVYDDGSSVPAEKIINNPVAANVANSGSNVGFGKGVAPAEKVYEKVLKGKTGLTVLAEDAPTYGDAIYDPVNKIVIVRDENGTSIYNEQGNLISGKGSARQVGIASGSAGRVGQIDINAVGSYGTPEYQYMAGTGKKQNLAAQGTPAQKAAFASLGTQQNPYLVGGKPFTGTAGGMQFVNGIQQMPVATTATTANISSSTTVNPFAPGSDAAKAWNERKSAYDLLYSEFSKYGLQSLVTPLKDLVQQGVSPSEFAIELRNSEPYQKRFSANKARIGQGLRALSEAEYIGLEDAYQDVMRRYGLPESFYSQQVDPVTGIKTQVGFEKFLAGDVSPVELEDRIQNAQSRVFDANQEVAIALRNFYPGIKNGDILAYVLDPKNALPEIKRKITAAEIGGAAVQAGLTTNESDAEYLARYGVTKEQAQQGYRTISGYLPRAQQLSSIYGKQVEGGPYTQASAEREVFNVPGAAEEERKRQKITSLEQAQFSGSAGLTGGALGRERAGQF